MAGAGNPRNDMRACMPMRPGSAEAGSAHVFAQEIKPFGRAACGGVERSCTARMRPVSPSDGRWLGTKNSVKHQSTSASCSQKPVEDYQLGKSVALHGRHLRVG
jgi:hypothetical protein